MIHDFAITERHVVFMDLPVVFDLEWRCAAGCRTGWSDDYGARLGLMPRGGAAADVRWFEVAPCYVFHPLNAYEDGGRRRRGRGPLRRAVARRLGRPVAGPASPVACRPGAGGRVSEQPLDDRPIAFPRCDERRQGLPHRYG